MSAEISSETIQNALQRAKELAACSQTDQVKRPAEDLDTSGEYPDPKRIATMEMVGGNPIATLGNNPMMIPNPMSNAETIIESIEVPDHCVGLVIGRGGEQISQIQTTSGCRVQMSPEADTNNMRQCTLQGTKIAIDKARGMIVEVVNRAGNRPPPGRNSPMGGMPNFGGVPDGMMGGMGMGGMVGGPGGQKTVHEMLIPGSQCGLVIGKGGETIKNIQETAGVKMTMIQENQEVSMGPKPLRIMGDPDKVEHAKRLVDEILTSRDDNPPQRGAGGPGGLSGPGPGRFNAYGSQIGGASGPRSIGEVIVPRSSVGMIIGKGGETIKRLAMETGAKIQFKPDEDTTTPDRCAVIQGTADQIAQATAKISELVNKSGSGGNSETFYMHVPSNKTGLVIGKGGETIKQICGESGAHVELSREPPPNSSEKIFVIRGSPYQIHHATHIIRIKVGDVAPGTPVPPFAGQQDSFGQQPAQNYNAGQYGGQQGWNNFGGGQPQQANDPNAAAWANYYAQQQYQASSGYPYQQQTAAPGTQTQAQNNTTPAINPQTGQADYSAQWVEYYRNLGMHEQASIIEQQAKQNATQGAQTGAQPPRPQQPNFGGNYGNAAAAPQPNQFNYGAPQTQPAAQTYQFAGNYQ